MLRNIEAPIQSLLLTIDVKCAVKKRKGRKKRKHHPGIPSAPATGRCFEYRQVPNISSGATTPRNAEFREATTGNRENQGKAYPWRMLAPLVAFLVLAILALWLVFGPTPRGVTTTRIVSLGWRSFEARSTTSGGDDTRKEDHHAPTFKHQEDHHTMPPGRSRKRHYHKVFHSHRVKQNRYGRRGCRCRSKEPSNSSSARTE